VSDPSVVASVTALARAIAPTCAVIARARYHVAEAEISEQGATQVVDEELLVGRALSAAAMESINDAARGA
jgi:hypothetical protein